MKAIFTETEQQFFFHFFVLPSIRFLIYFDFFFKFYFRYKNLLKVQLLNCFTNLQLP